MSSSIPALRITDNADADRLLSTNPFALLIGMLLDQQVAMELAFLGPARLEQRIEGPLTPATIAAIAPEQLEVLFRDKPALHRYPGSMASRVHALANYLVEHYGGDAAAVWNDAEDGTSLKRRLRALPGFGDQKTRIFIALLGKQYHVTPTGWREAAGDYGLEGFRSIADVTSPETLANVRAFKQEQKAQVRATS